MMKSRVFTGLFISFLITVGIYFSYKFFADRLIDSEEINISSKRNINGPVLSTPRNDNTHIVNDESDRVITYVKFTSDYEDIEKGESLETDTCLNIFDGVPKQESGEEIFCLHHMYSFSRKNKIEQVINLKDAMILWPKGKTLSCASTSLLMPAQINNDSERYNDGITGFECSVGYLEGLPGEANNRSYRSPNFDRITVAHQASESPFSLYKNTGDKSIMLSKVILFEANISSSVASSTEIIIEVNEDNILQKKFYQHVPERVNVAKPSSIDLDVEIKSGDSVKVYCRTTSDIPIINDCATYLIVDGSLELVGESDYYLDINEDGICDFVTKDSTQNTYITFGIGVGKGYDSQIVWESFYEREFDQNEYSSDCDLIN